MIINTMQHQLTPVQISSLEMSSIGNNKIISLREIDSELFEKLANCPADSMALYDLANRLAEIVNDSKPEAVILPIGSPAFMFIFAQKMSTKVGTHFLFSHTERNSVEETQPDGSVVKKTVFNHVKWLNV